VTYPRVDTTLLTERYVSENPRNFEGVDELR